MGSRQRDLPPVFKIGRNKATNLWQFRCAPCRVTLSATFSRVVREDLKTHLVTPQHAAEVALWKAALRREAVQS